MELTKLLKNLIPDEIIHGSNVEKTAEMVDLDIAYTLLLVEDYVHSKEAFERYSNIPSVVKAEKVSDDKYMIRFKTKNGPDFRMLTVDEAKIMRARFLLLKGFYTTNFNRLTLPKQREVASKFNLGFIPDILIKGEE